MGALAIPTCSLNALKSPEKNKRMKKTRPLFSVWRPRHRPAEQEGEEKLHSANAQRASQLQLINGNDCYQKHPSLSRTPPCLGPEPTEQVSPAYIIIPPPCVTPCLASKGLPIQHCIVTTRRTKGAKMSAGRSSPSLPPCSCTAGFHMEMKGRKG